MKYEDRQIGFDRCYIIRSGEDFIVRGKIKGVDSRDDILNVKCGENAERFQDITFEPLVTSATSIWFQGRVIFKNIESEGFRTIHSTLGPLEQKCVPLRIEVQVQKAIFHEAVTFTDTIYCHITL